MNQKEDLQLYDEIVYRHKLSIRTMIREFLLSKFAKKHRVRELPQDPRALFPSELENQAFIYLAVVQDNKVVEMLRLKRNVGEVIKKSKTKFVEYDPSKVPLKKGMFFKDKKFFSSEGGDVVQ
jgi:hypothetical protein